MNEQIKLEAQSLLTELTALRREFHRYAEPGWLEMRTTSRIARELKNMGYEELLLGDEVCLDTVRMGLPDRASLDAHYRWAEENGADEFFLPGTAGGFTGLVAYLRCGEGRRWRCALILTRSACVSVKRTDTAPMRKVLHRWCRG